MSVAASKDDGWLKRLGAVCFAIRGPLIIVYVVSMYQVFWHGVLIWPLAVASGVPLALGIWPYDSVQAMHKHKSKWRSLYIGVGTPLLLLAFWVVNYWRLHW